MPSFNRTFEVRDAPVSFVDPSSLAGLTLWLDASDSGTITHSAGSVTQWADKSGVVNNMVQTNGSIYEPTTGVATQAGLNLLRFVAPEFLDGVTYADVTSSTDITVFEVSKLVTGTAYNSLGVSALIRSATWFPDVGAPSVAISPAMTNAMLLKSYALDYVADSHSLRVNGVQVATSTTAIAASSATELRVNETFDGRGDTDVAEIVIYNRKLSPSEITEVEGYLIAKWGLGSAFIVSFTDAAGWANGTTPETATGIAWNAGDIIAVVCSTSNDTGVIGVPTNANLSFVRAESASSTPGTDLDPEAHIWVAYAASAQTAQTITLTSTGGAGLYWSFGVYVVRGSSGLGTKIASYAEAALSMAVEAGSTVLYVEGDWAAPNVRRTLLTGSGTATERLDGNGGTIYDYVVGDWQNTVAGTFNFGLTDYTGMTIAQTAIELRAGQFFTDDFNRADGALGANWSAYANLGSVGIVSNKAQAGTTGDHYAHWAGGAVAADQWSEADCALWGGSDGEAWIGVRMTGTNGGAGSTANGYIVTWDEGGSYVLYEVLNGAWTQLAMETLVGTTGTRRLRLQIVGSRLDAFADGVPIPSMTNITDTTYTSGSPGIGLWTQNANQPTIDNWAGGEM